MPFNVNHQLVALSYQSCLSLLPYTPFPSFGQARPSKHPMLAVQESSPTAADRPWDVHSQGGT